MPNTVFLRLYVTVNPHTFKLNFRFGATDCKRINMKKPLKILMLEDSVADAELIQRELLKEKPHCEFKLVMNKVAYLEALDKFKPDLILSDNTLPQINATEALELFNLRSLPIPFILVTGTVSEEFAAEIIKQGADDYILKDRLKRLPTAIDAALQKKKAQAEARQNEELRKLIINSALDGIICMDVNGIITVWNPRAEQLFGWTATEIIGKSLSETIIPPAYRELHTHGFKDHLGSEKSPVLYKVREVTALHKDGSVFPIEIAIISIQQNSADFFCAFIRDISERKQAEANLKVLEQKMYDQQIEEHKKISRAVIKAQEAEKNHIGQELHDNISQILASTKMYLSTAANRNKSLKDVLTYPIELIDNSIKAIRSLSHKQVTPLKNIDLKSLIQKLLEGLGHSAMPKFNFVYAVPEKLLGDGFKLNIYRMVQELLNNTQKHAAAKNVDVIIKTEGNDINVTVADNGKGFEPGNKRKGIGISNIMNRAELYNGNVILKTSPGKGCTVSVLMPYELKC